jgi:hypothetical protein
MDLPLAELATTASATLGAEAKVSDWSQTAELLVESRIDDPHNFDERWMGTESAEVRTELRPLRIYRVSFSTLYRASFATGIASADPSLNFSLQKQLSLDGAARPLRLKWDQVVAFQSDVWALSAVHMQQPSLSTEVIIQGPWGDPQIVVAEASRFTEYDVAGVSLTDRDGRMLTFYDGGQLWLQNVGPDDVVGVFEKVVSQLVSQN